METARSERPGTGGRGDQDGNAPHTSWTRRRYPVQGVSGRFAANVGLRGGTRTSD